MQARHVCRCWPCWRCSQISFGTALPTPKEGLSYPRREAGWARVTLRSLKLENSVATADFSRELRAYVAARREAPVWACWQAPLLPQWRCCWQMCAANEDSGSDIRALRAAGGSYSALLRAISCSW
jgi:hypothetical protein